MVLFATLPKLVNLGASKLDPSTGSALACSFDHSATIRPFADNFVLFIIAIFLIL